jgi:hypothetical protein
MRGEMSKALGPERFVPEGLHEGSLARSAWKRVIRAIPSRRERCDRVGTSGFALIQYSTFSNTPPLPRGRGRRRERGRIVNATNPELSL